VSGFYKRSRNQVQEVFQTKKPRYTHFETKEECMTLPKYFLSAPEQQKTFVVFSSPHSGRDYRAEFMAGTVLRDPQVRSSEDAYVDELFASAPHYGAPLLSASLPRAFVDVNRAIDELDPAVVSGVKHVLNNPRISSGLGVIPRVVAEGRAIRSAKLSLEAAQALLKAYYTPFHQKLAQMLEDTAQRFGQVLLIDCHSMPHDAILNARAPGGRRPDVILGDRFGASCNPDLSEAVAALFAQAGFTVGRNAPFAGAFIAQNYGRPESGRHVLQIEIDRQLYLNEAKVTKSAGFEDLKERLSRVVAGICDLGRLALPLAAE
jgi:N-formylglutamate amidohydrolase